MSYEYADGFKIRDQNCLHFLTFTVVGWMVFSAGKPTVMCFLKTMEYCRKNKQLSVGAFVIMTNHLHLIWRSECGRLSDTIRDFKSYCTKEFISMIEKEESRKDWLLHMFRFHANRTNQNNEFRIWTGNNHPEEIHPEKLLMTKLNYIHNHPVRAGWVEKPEDYLYSSASNYVSGKGVAGIDYL